MSTQGSRLIFSRVPMVPGGTADRAQAMKVLILGATGRVGIEVVREALQLGHQVTVLVRRPGPMPEAVRVIQGSATDPEVLDTALAGQDAVLCAVGNPKGAGPEDRTVSRVTSALVQAMKRVGVRRLVAVSAFGVADSLEQTSRLFRWFVLPGLRGAYADKEAQEAEIRSSGLDWLIVRPARLVVRAPNRRYRVIEGAGKIHESCSTAEVARFMVERLSIAAARHLAINLGSERGPRDRQSALTPPT